MTDVSSTSSANDWPQLCCKSYMTRKKKASFRWVRNIQYDNIWGVLSPAGDTAVCKGNVNLIIKFILVTQIAPRVFCLLKPLTSGAGLTEIMNLRLRTFSSLIRKLVVLITQ